MQSSKKGKCVCTQDAGIFYTKHLLFLQCVCSQGKRFQTRHHSTVPSPKRCVCLNRIKSPILSLSLSPVHSRASALFFWCACHLRDPSLFLVFTLSFFLFTLKIMVHVCTLQMHTMYNHTYTTCRTRYRAGASKSSQNQQVQCGRAFRLQAGLISVARARYPISLVLSQCLSTAACPSCQPFELQKHSERTRTHKTTLFDSPPPPPRLLQTHICFPE